MRDKRKRGQATFLQLKSSLSPFFDGKKVLQYGKYFYEKEGILNIIPYIIYMGLSFWFLVNNYQFLIASYTLGQEKETEMLSIK